MAGHAWDADDSAKLSSAERKALEGVLKRREKEAAESADEVKAQRIASFEEELAQTFSAEDEAFADVTALAKELVAKANEEIDHRCDELGIRKAFRPGLHLVWRERGFENMDKERRAELRRVAEKRAEADKLAVRKQITGTFTDELEKLATGMLNTDEAKTFLERMPRPEALMPEVKLAALDVGDAKLQRDRWQRGGAVPLLALGEGDDPSEPEEDDDEDGDF